MLKVDGSSLETRLDMLYKGLQGVVPAINADEILIPQPHFYQE